MAPVRIVPTFEFEGAPGHVVLETLTLDEVDGRTKYVAPSVHQSVEAAPSGRASEGPNAGGFWRERHARRTGALAGAREGKVLEITVFPGVFKTG